MKNIISIRNKEELLRGIAIIAGVVIFAYVVFYSHIFVNMKSGAKFIGKFYNEFEVNNYSLIYYTMMDDQLQGRISAQQFTELMDNLHLKVGNTAKQKISYKCSPIIRRKGAIPGRRTSFSFFNLAIFYKYRFVVQRTAGRFADDFLLMKDGGSWKILDFNVTPN